MASSYPGALDNLPDPASTDTEDGSVGGIQHDVLHVDTNNAIEAAQATLGVNPQGTFSTVAARLTALGGNAWPIDLPPASPNTMDDEFSGSSLDGKWTAYAPSGSATIAVSGGLLSYTCPLSSGVNYSGIGQPLPGSGDWQFTAAIAGLDFELVNYMQPAMMFLAESSSGTSNKILMNCIYPAGSYVFGGVASNWTTSANQATAPFYNLNAGYLRITKSGSTYTSSYSITGGRFFTVFSSSSIGFTPGRILIGNEGESSTISPTAYFKWFRRTA